MRWAILLLLACGGADNGDLFRDVDAGQAEQAQTRDCRPVRFEDCYNAFNDRACFTLPPGCARERLDTAE
jgi:hypothetical protein